MVPVAASAVLALAVAGAMIAHPARESDRRRIDAIRPGLTFVSFSAAEPPAAPDGDPGAARSPLSVTRVGEGKAKRTVVSLGRPACSEDFRKTLMGTDQGILLREVVRQAVLLAARDELGLATRDEVLGEAVAGAPEARGAEVSSVFREKGISRATIRKVGGAKAEPLLDKPLPGPSLPELVETAEALSRTELPAALKALGLSGVANTRRVDAPLPEGTEDLLSRLGQTDAFAAVRGLHTAIRADGESPARLGALARGYALLGILTEYQWSPAHKAFKARALLYSQRLVAADPADPFALWNRAFVRALVGMHAGAMSDLTRARKQADEHAKPAPAAPDWVPLIDAYVRYDTKHMRAGHESEEGLAALLRLMAVEFPRSRRSTLKASKEILSRDPDCFRAVDAVCRDGGLNDLHAATQFGPAVLDQLVPKKLLAMKGLPARVGEAVARNPGGPAPEDALRDAGGPALDESEPSWGVLGHLVAEARFVQVMRRFLFLRDKLSVPVGEYWAEAGPTIAGHRYYPSLEARTHPPREGSRLLVEFLDRIDLSDLEVKEVWMLSTLMGLPSPRASLPWTAGSVHHDALAHDLEEICSHSEPPPVYFARELLVVSEHSPSARALLIENDWEFARPRLAEWEKDPATANTPVMLAALARRYTQVGRADDARDALRRYIALSPDYWSYDMLAENYKARGDLDSFKATLDEYLKKGENSGLDFAKAQVKLASFLMGRERWAEAKPYAETSAETGAFWAMQCAGQCSEGLGDYIRAEFWFRQATERYSGSFMEWFLFCKRTHRGDSAAATRLAVDFVDEAGGRLIDNAKTQAIFLFDLSDDPSRGVALVRAMLGTESPPAGTPGGRLPTWIEKMFLARFADSLDDKTLRDETWARVANGGHPAAAGIATLFRDAVKAGAGSKFDRKSLDHLLGSTDAVSRSFLGYFAGRFLARRGKVGDAADVLRLYSEPIPGGDDYVPLLADNALRDCLKGEIPAEPDLYVLRAAFHRDEDQPDLALKDLDQAVRLDPKNKPALNLRGIVRRDTGNLDGAIADFGKMIELDPDDPAARLGRGVTYILRGQDAEAGDDINRIIERAFRSGLGQMGRGLLALARGQAAEADAAFGQALELDKGLSKTIEGLKMSVKKKRQPKGT